MNDNDHDHYRLSRKKKKKKHTTSFYREPKVYNLFIRCAGAYILYIEIRLYIYIYISQMNLLNQ